MQCPQCSSEMLRNGDYYFCGQHTPPVIRPVRALFIPNLQDNPSDVSYLPMPLALPLAAYMREHSSYIAIHRLSDVAEIVTRFLAIIALCDVYAQLGKFPLDLENTLAEKFERPTFGAWREICDAALHQIDTHKCTPFIPALPTFWRRFWRPLLGSGDDPPHEKFISLRNHLAHAGYLTESAAHDLLAAHQGHIDGAIQELHFLADVRVIATQAPGQPALLLRGQPRPDWSLPTFAHGAYPEHLQPQQVYLLYEDSYLCLFPLHLYALSRLWKGDHFEDSSPPASMLYLRYNKRRESIEFTVLGPKSTVAQPQEDCRTAYLSIFDVAQWQHRHDSIKEGRAEWRHWEYDFSALQNELTRGIQGREAQLSEAKSWVRAHQRSGGILWIGGTPGVGKSAFIATLAHRLKGDPQMVVLPYFFRSGDVRCNPDHFYRAATLYLVDKFSLTLPQENNETPESVFMRALEVIQPQTGDKASISLLMLLDGLDEVIKLSPAFLRVVLAQQQPGLSWIFCGRDEPQLLETFVASKADRLWDGGQLPPLDAHAVRALVQEECWTQRFDLLARDEAAADDANAYRNRFIERLVQRSEGLPLYVQLVVEDITTQRLSFWDEERLPKGLSAYYKQLLEWLKVSDVSQILTDVLALLCLAYEPLPETTLATGVCPTKVNSGGAGAWGEERALVTQRRRARRQHGRGDRRRDDGRRDDHRRGWGRQRTGRHRGLSGSRTGEGLEIGAASLGLGLPEVVPAAGALERPQAGDGLEAGPAPTHPRPLRARRDQDLAGALHRARANGQLPRHKTGIVQARRMRGDVADGDPHDLRSRVRLRRQRVQRRQDRRGALLIQAVFERLHPGGGPRAPGPKDGVAHRPEVLIHMVDVHDLDHLDAPDAEEVRRAMPDPLRAIAE